MAGRPFITCHALDTTTGKPAADVSVTLRLIEPSNIAKEPWSAKTNSDGRVLTWTAASQAEELNSSVAKAKDNLGDEDEMIWSLTFETGAYYGKGKTFWPQVELRFAAKKEEEHYHVPLLLGPWSYTTYRGS